MCRWCGVSPSKGGVGGRPVGSPGALPLHRVQPRGAGEREGRCFAFCGEVVVYCFRH
jgi:hypothetical protein